MKTLVIIGAGFSGAVTAAQFLRHSPADVRVVLINRSGAMARGLAYGTNSSLHLLNVPTGNMSADVDDPEHFLRFCRVRDAACTASSFVPRKIYGEYLTSVLDGAEKHCARGVTLERIVAEVRSLQPRETGAVVELTNGQCIEADQVVLAFGNFSPLDPPGFCASMGAERYQPDPWAGASAPSADPNRAILLVGAGLTALDVSLGLLQSGHKGPIYMVSRRGLRPLPHRPKRTTDEVPADFAERLLQVTPSVRAYLQLIRREIKAARNHRLDWRDLVAALRPITPDLWIRLPMAERRRFLRHLQPYWDVHRHRVAPAAYQRFEEALETGQVRCLAGRIKSVETGSDYLRIGIQRRNQQALEEINVAQVINCTGPTTDLRRVKDPLIQQLCADGVIQVDTLGLGVCVNERLAVKSSSGICSSWLYYVGPMLKADYWEATAVPELRQYSKKLAVDLVAIINK
ncbi:FAD/NAD(P)-binding protein [Pseudomonas sp. RA_105y_Pfl2_P56]|uniref:FAD/NAD(P)-binding protein n=1 Tax=Pseudomonas sp. RA_105y_Pfl2_P56 TaxID=3088701 RepID=UPI0030D83E5F